MRVLTVIITAKNVEPRCWDSVVNQTHKDCSTLLYQRPASIQHENEINRLYRNCAQTREEARVMALASKADGFMFVDSDIVLPKTAIEESIRQAQPTRVATLPKPIAAVPGQPFKVDPGELSSGMLPMCDRGHRVIGGWYNIRGDRMSRYTCGRWVDQGVFLNFPHPQNSVVKTDVVGLGCAFIPRVVLEKVSFRHGCDEVCTSANYGSDIILGECGAFGMDVQSAGFDLFMDGDIVCEHLQRRE